MTHSSEPGGPVFAPYAGFAASWPAGHADTTVYSIAAAHPSFDFDYYDMPMDFLNISADGYLQIDAGASPTYSTAGLLPDPAEPNGVVAAWWEDLDPAAGGQVEWGLFGTSGSEVFAIHWLAPHRVPAGPPGPAVNVEVHFHEDTGDIIFHFIEASSDIDGLGETVGIENHDGTLGSAWYQQSVTAAEVSTALRFSPYVAGEIDYDSDGYLACEDCDDTDDQVTGPCTE